MWLYLCMEPITSWKGFLIIQACHKELRVTLFGLSPEPFQLTSHGKKMGISLRAFKARNVSFEKEKQILRMPGLYLICRAILDWTKTRCFA